MSKWQSALPRYRENEKGLQGTERLATVITGGIIWSGVYPDKRRDIFFLNHEQFGKLNGFLVYMHLIGIGQ